MRRRTCFGSSCHSKSTVVEYRSLRASGSVRPYAVTISDKKLRFSLHSGARLPLQFVCLLEGLFTFCPITFDEP